MHKLARFLSVVAITSATIAVAVAYYSYPPIGYEGVIFVSSVAVVLAILSALLSLTLVAYIFLTKKAPKPINTTAIAVAAIAMAFAYVWSI